MLGSFFLAHLSLRFVLGPYLPRISYSTKLDTYVMLCLLFILAAVVEAVVAKQAATGGGAAWCSLCALPLDETLWLVLGALWAVTSALRGCCSLEAPAPLFFRQLELSTLSSHPRYTSQHTLPRRPLLFPIFPREGGGRLDRGEAQALPGSVPPPQRRRAKRKSAACGGAAALRRQLLPRPPSRVRQNLLLPLSAHGRAHGLPPLFLPRRRAVFLFEPARPPPAPL